MNNEYIKNKIASLENSLYNKERIILEMVSEIRSIKTCDDIEVELIRSCAIFDAFSIIAPQSPIAAACLEAIQADMEEAVVISLRLLHKAGYELPLDIGDAVEAVRSIRSEVEERVLRGDSEETAAEEVKRAFNQRVAS